MSGGIVFPFPNIIILHFGKYFNGFPKAIFEIFQGLIHLRFLVVSVVLFLLVPGPRLSRKYSAVLHTTWCSQ